MGVSGVEEVYLPGGRRLLLGRRSLVALLLGMVLVVLFVPLLVLGGISVMEDIDAIVMVALVLVVPVAVVPCLIISHRILIILRWMPWKQSINSMERYSAKMRLYMDTSRVGHVWMVSQILLSLAACAFYVVEQYAQEEKAWLVFAELALSVLFAVDYLLFFYCAEDRLLYFFSFFALIDLFTVYPVFASLLFDALRTGSVFLRPLRVLRALRIIRAYRLFSFSSSDVQRQLMAVGLTVFSLIFCSAALMQFVETYGDRSLGEANPFFYFHDCLYFVTVTFATVGYGDVTPITETGRMVVTCLILLGMFLIPFQSFKAGHVLVLGHITATGVFGLFRELFHKQSAFRNTRVVLLSPVEPDYGTLRLMSHPFYKHRVTFLVGSALLPRDLERAKIDSAKACFVLTGRSDVDSARADSEATMMMLAVKDFNRQLYTCGQLLSAEHKHAACDLPNTDVVVLEELNMSILSRNCRTPGFSTLIANLVQTYSNSERSELWKPYDWRQEYHYGCSHELYTVELPSEYVGMTFCEVALLIYERHQQTLIAAECELRDGSSMLLANPAGDVARLRAGTRCFVMALSRKKAMKITSNGEDIPESAFGMAPSYKKGPARDQRINDIPMLPVLASRRSFEGSRRSLEEVRGVPVSNRRKSTSGAPQIAGEEIMLGSEEGDEEFVEHEDDLSWLMMQKAKRTVREVVSETGGLGPWTSVYPGFKVEDLETACEDCHPCTRLNGHLIVAGSVEGLVDLIAPLRSVDTVQDIPVVIINPEPVPEAIWNIIGRFPDVFFVKGKASDYRALALAQISTASSIVLLTDPTNRSLDGQMIDAETVFTFRRLMPRLQTAFLVAELAQGSNVRFISPGLDPDFAVRQQISQSTGVSSLTTSGELLHPEYHYNPFFAAGQVYTSSVLDSLLCRLPNNPQLLEVLELLAVGGTTPRQLQDSSHIYQFPVAVECTGKSYGEVFEHYVRRHRAIPLGLYRWPTEGCRNALPYVFTNPLPSVTVSGNDRVFLLCPVDEARQLQGIVGPGVKTD